MAWFIPNAGGLPWGTAATWDTVTNTPTIHATTNIILTTATVSLPFTAPNTINKSTGVSVLNISQSTAATFTATLQEDIGGTGSWVDTTATATITIASVKAAWLYFRWVAPYTFATTGANRYRIKLVRNAGNPNVAADSGGLNFAYLHSDDRHSVPGATDSAWIIGANNATSTVITVSSSQSCGNEGTLAANAGLTNRTVTVSAMIANGGVLNFDTAGCTLTSKGNIITDAGGELRMGTLASPIPVANTCQLIFNMTTTDTVGLHTLNSGILNMYGATRTWKTTYVSGVGTAASPLVTADAMDWQVGDQITVSPGTNSATNYNECEERFVITRNSSTSFVLSSTSGGAETAFSFTHIITSEVLLLTRNAVVKGISTVLNTFVFCAAQSFSGNINILWARTENTCNQSTLAAINLANRIDNVNYTVVYRPGRLGFLVSGTLLATYTGLIATQNTSATTSTTGGGFWFSSAKRKVMVDCYAINNQGAGFSLASAFSNVFTRCKAIACMKGLGSILAGISFSVSGQNSFTDCEIQASRFSGMIFISATDCTFTRLLAGNKAQNQSIDINLTGSTYDTATFIDCIFGSTTMLSNYLNLLDGSEIRFHNLQQTVNNHSWFSNLGSARSTGAGLIDTSVRTPGSLGARLASEDGNQGFTWSFHIPAKARSIVNFFGYFMLNTTFTGDLSAIATVSLFLPGSDVADSIVTLNNARNDWQAVVLSAQNHSDTDGLAQIQVNSLTATPSAYVYADDFYNAGNTVISSDKVTGLDTWFNGKPIDIITPQATSAADIWSFPTADLVTQGTTGKQLKDALTQNKFMGLK